MLTQYQKDRIVKMYTVKKYTLEQTSKHFGITRERVRQIVREQIDIKGRLSTTIKSKNNCKLCGKAFTVTPSLVKTKLYCCTKHGRRGKIKYFTKALKNTINNATIPPSKCSRCMPAIINRNDSLGLPFTRTVNDSLSTCPLIRTCCS